MQKKVNKNFFIKYFETNGKFRQYLIKNAQNTYVNQKNDDYFNEKCEIILQNKEFCDITMYVFF